MDIWYYVLSPFTWLLTQLYNLFGTYGLALIVFAMIIKVVLFPLSLKGKRGMIQMNMMQGKTQAIQKKYPNDKNKQNVEIQKLYAKENVNPMGGCLWSMLPLFVLLPLYAIIRQPMKYAMGLTTEQITTLMEVLGQYSSALIDSTSAYVQLEGADVLAQNFSAVLANPAVSAFKDSLLNLNFNMFGINLASIPNLMFWEDGISWSSIGLFLIPWVSAGTGFAFSRISMKTNAVNTQSEQSNGTAKSMMWMTPLMSLWIGFVMPGCLGIYWIANNILSMIQEFFAGKMLKKDYEAAAKAKEEEELRAKEEEKEQRRLASERKAQAMAESKKNKKAAAVEKKKNDTAVIGVSGVGVRAYARGRGYDPNRFSEDGPTTYRDPSFAVDEAAVEAALEKKSLFKRKKAEEVPEVVETVEIPETAALPEGESQPAETAAAAAPEMDVEDPWKAVDEALEEKKDEENQ